MFSPSLTSNLKPIFIKAAISVGVLALVFYFVPVSKVYAAILVVDPLWLVAGIALQILLRVFTALRMQAIAESQRLGTSYLSMMRVVFSSTFYNILAPGALAGGIVTYAKYRQLGVRPVAAVANIYTNKSIELLVVSLPAPLFWLIDKGFGFYLIVAYGLTMVIAFYCAFALFFGRFGNLQWLESKINYYGQSVVHQALASLCRQLGQIGQMSHRVIISLVAYSAIYSLLAAVAIICFGNALYFEMELLPILWIYPVIYLLAMLPISISNIGVREVSMIMLLAPYGVATTEAIACSLLMYSGLLCSGLIGLVLEAEHFWLRKDGGRAIKSTACQLTTNRQQGTDGGSNEG